MLIGAATLILPSLAGAASELSGAGARVPSPILATWFMQLARDPAVASRYNPSATRVNYLPTDSAAGIQAMIDNTVDFAATDQTPTDEQLKQMERGAVLLPVVASQVVIAYNLPGAEGLRLPRTVYPKIFAGAIESWNDPAIAAANPTLALPEQPIIVVVRSDAGSTSATVSGHLSAIDAEFRQSIGAAHSPKWPEGERFIREDGNDGVAAKLLETPGSIGYMEHGYAQLTDWRQIAWLENQAGEFVKPGLDSGRAALSSVALPTGTLPGGASKAPDLRISLRDPDGEGAYPILTPAWLLFHATGYAPDQRDAVLGLVDYGLSDAAQSQASGLGYVPLPETLLDAAREAADTITANPEGTPAGNAE
jgi:phosphate transport system substrate-binding protein